MTQEAESKGPGSEHRRPLLNRKHLIPQEKVVWEDRPSFWIVVMRPLVLVILTLVFAVIVTTYAGDVVSLIAALVVCGLMIPFHRIYGLIAAIAGVVVAFLVASGQSSLAFLVFVPIVVGLIPFVLTYLRWTRTVFAVTDRRIISQYGLLSVSYNDTGIDRVQSITVRQPWYEKLFGFGDVHIDTAGGGVGAPLYRAAGLRLTSSGGVVWENVSKPFQVERMLSSLVYGQAKPTAPTKEAATVPSSVEQKIVELSDMKEKGLVTEEEFEEKRKELIKNM